MILSLAHYWLSLRYWERASAASIKSMQVRKFRKLFAHAKQYSRFYREFYHEHGVENLEIESFEDIAKVPIINKAILRKYSTRDIMTCDLDKRIHVHSTSGSTGEPFKIACNSFEDYTAHVRLLKALMGNGYQPFKKLVLLSRYAPGHKFAIEEDLNKIGWLQNKMGLFSRELISIFEPVKTIITKLEQIKPYVLWSTPSIIEIIALDLKKTNKKLDIPLVLFMSETISPSLEDLFKERIGRNYLNLYGCMESPSIGYGRNQRDVNKIFSNSTLVEVINRRQMEDKSVGDIVITNLINHSMPLIRYDLADYAGVLDDDSFPVKQLGEIYGRCDDIIYFGDHYTLTYHQTYQLFRAFHECLQYKFIQNAAGEIVLQLKVSETADKEKVKRAALQKWGEKYPNYPLAIEWKDFSAIDRKTGKFKVIEKAAG